MPFNELVRVNIRQRIDQTQDVTGKAGSSPGVIPSTLDKFNEAPYPPGLQRVGIGNSETWRFLSSQEISYTGDAWNHERSEYLDAATREVREYVHPFNNVAGVNPETGAWYDDFHGLARGPNEFVMYAGLSRVPDDPNDEDNPPDAPAYPFQQAAHFPRIIYPWGTTGVRGDDAHYYESTEQSGFSSYRTNLNKGLVGFIHPYPRDKHWRTRYNEVNVQEFTDSSGNTRVATGYGNRLPSVQEYKDWFNRAIAAGLYVRVLNPIAGLRSTVFSQVDQTANIPVGELPFEPLIPFVLGKVADVKFVEVERPSLFTWRGLLARLAPYDGGLFSGNHNPLLGTDVIGSEGIDRHWRQLNGWWNWIANGGGGTQGEQDLIDNDYRNWDEFPTLRFLDRDDFNALTYTPRPGAALTRRPIEQVLEYLRRYTRNNELPTSLRGVVAPSLSYQGNNADDLVEMTSPRTWHALVVTLERALPKHEVVDWQGAKAANYDPGSALEFIVTDRPDEILHLPVTGEASLDFEVTTKDFWCEFVDQTVTQATEADALTEAQSELFGEAFTEGVKVWTNSVTLRFRRDSGIRNHLGREINYTGSLYTIGGFQDDPENPSNILAVINSTIS